MTSKSPGAPAVWAKFENIEKWNYPIRMVSLDPPCDGENFKGQHEVKGLIQPKLWPDWWVFGQNPAPNHKNAENEKIAFFASF